MNPIDRIQGRALILAASFLVLFASILTISAAVLARSWQVEYPWKHWLGLLIWGLTIYLVHRQTTRRIPERDPLLLPIAALLCGWGMLTIWRLDPLFGARQMLWLIVAMLVFMAGLRLRSNLAFLRKFKYLWLSLGLLLTGLTLFFGTNPLGYGPRLWLGCCGIYFQPSEPLKLLLVIYLAAYLADRRHFLSMSIPIQQKSSGRVNRPLLPFLAPTLIMTGMSMLLLVAQRDLGTASIFLILYAVIVYIATANYRVLLASGFSLLIAGIIGYLAFDIVKIRIDAWLNPWIDPAGRSYQVIQSLIAIANGGIEGRGPGIGFPGLVPVAISDFIYAAISEETGLIGAMALLLILALLYNRGIRSALNAPDIFRRYLAAGITVLLVSQSLLIIAGNIRLLPLTGVTLPFVSYGGSSLTTCFICILILLHISAPQETPPAPLPTITPYHHLTVVVSIFLAALAIFSGWWALYRAPDLLSRPDNARLGIAERYVTRGAILASSDEILAESIGSIGELQRNYPYPELGATVGYTLIPYSQAGLEASQDAYLRGIQDAPAFLLWYHHLVYGQTPPGMDIRTSLNLELQTTADQGLNEYTGAAVLINAQNGEILVMASHPTFDANQLTENFASISQDPDAPLINRATMGLYPLGAVMGSPLLARLYEQGSLPPLPGSLAYTFEQSRFNCALTPTEMNWGALIAAGCPGAIAAIGQALGSQQLLSFYQELALFEAPQIRLPTAATSLEEAGLSSSTSAGLAALGINSQNGTATLKISPLQAAIAAAILSNSGNRPAPQLVLAVDKPTSGWELLPALSTSSRALTPVAVRRATDELGIQDLPIWESLAYGYDPGNPIVTWYIAGTLPNWQGVPLALAVVVEAQDPELALEIGRSLMTSTLHP